MDKMAHEHIKELEEQIHDLQIKLDLAETDRDEWKARAMVLEGQLRLLRIDRRYEVA